MGYSRSAGTARAGRSNQRPGGVPCPRESWIGPLVCQCTDRRSRSRETAVERDVARAVDAAVEVPSGDLGPSPNSRGTNGGGSERRTSWLSLWRGAGLHPAGPPGPALGGATDSGLPLLAVVPARLALGAGEQVPARGAATAELRLTRLPRRSCSRESGGDPVESASQHRCTPGGPTLACCRDTGENPGCAWEAGTVAWQWIRPVRKGWRDECAANE